MSREFTTDEVRNQFLDHVRGLIEYWSTVDLDQQSDTVEYRVGGVVHSLLATLDGCSMVLPGFIVAPCPHEDDKQYNIDEGENWYPENHQSSVCADISGGLHELLYKKE